MCWGKHLPPLVVSVCRMPLQLNRSCAVWVSAWVFGTGQSTNHSFTQCKLNASKHMPTHPSHACPNTSSNTSTLTHVTPVASHWPPHPARPMSRPPSPGAACPAYSLRLQPSTPCNMTGWAHSLDAPPHKAATTPPLPQPLLWQTVLHLVWLPSALGAVPPASRSWVVSACLRPRRQQRGAPAVTMAPLHRGIADVTRLGEWW
jgi:hypothetical protein